MDAFIESVYDKYFAMCGGFPSGKCLDIAKEILEYRKGLLVGGYVGSGIEHWWVECDGKIIDPMYQDELHIPVFNYNLESGGV